MSRAARGTINPGMATAIYIPDPEAFVHADPFSASVAEDTFMLAGQLADALEILQQCHARNVSLDDEFFQYVDGLSEQIQSLQPGQKICAA